MRLPIIISAGLLLSLGLNIPAISQTQVQIAQAQTNNNLNLRRLKFNRNLWNQQNIYNYQYTLSNGCFCIPEARGPVVIKVRNGQTISITLADGQPANPEFFQKYNTIPKLFDVIQDAIERKASSLNVQYNHKLGYPMQINIDYSSQIADEELYLTIENFKKL
ncbi:hypothetical protein A6770_13755 [Nostoc minutum NIES-26]|uniref:Uncharacterized protein n=1 Tax=Nostoc minutum NIES-26 TaxID=1844469 RepID=A0A367RMZ8_9NOSO|nr:DUF6174 domain-containing protein [Dendronalium sp. ChiSLP03b]MDZ8205545.1 DUF6174 domain-containing protein [Dendronalium sp. ChiSLP03b]RCJ37855.1 hypothetical protein A6770_13755 [Nostoc minutum NIES-26]